jgi:hypothetical protein
MGLFTASENTFAPGTVRVDSAYLVVHWAVPGKVTKMRALSAVEAISPAINRTREFFFAPPFRWTTFLKLCLVAAITEGIGTNIQSNANKHNHPSPGSPGDVIFHFTPEMIAAIVAMSLLLILVALLIAYLVTRLRFAYFHCLVGDVPPAGKPLLPHEHRGGALFPAHGRIDVGAVCAGIHKTVQGNPGG